MIDLTEIDIEKAKAKAKAEAEEFINSGARDRYKNSEEYKELERMVREGIAKINKRRAKFAKSQPEIKI